MTQGPAQEKDGDTETYDSAPSVSTPYERVIGRYALCSPFARGGMATVHLARQVSDEGFSRVVAVKRLHAHVAESNESLAMFLDEARLASRIRHSNVVPTLDVVSRDGELLIVMEYVLGDSLSGLIRAASAKKTKIPIPIAVRIAIDMLHGLHAAHEAHDEDGAPLGLVHRDVSPQNVLVGLDGVPRIVDFGIAKAAGRIQTTQNNKLKGKLSYMAPEQLERTSSLDKRVDVYAVSIVLWEMLTMKRLFRGEDEIDTFKKALSLVVPPPSEHNDEVSADLDRVVMHGLARNRDDRPATARALARELEDLRIATSTTALADWVAETAADSLTEAKQRFAALEKAPPPTREQVRESLGSWSEGSVRAMVESRLAQSEAETDVIDAETASPITMTGLTPPGPASRKKKMLVAALLVGSAALGAWAMMGLRSTDSVAPSASSGPIVGSPEPDSIAPPSPAERSGDEEQASPEPPVEADAEAVPETEPETEPEEVKPVAPKKSAPAPTRAPVSNPRSPKKAASSSADDCKNPFTVDKDGVKVPKVHCL